MLRPSKATAGIVIGAATLAAAVAKRWGVNLRGWAFYQFAKLIAPDISDPTVLRNMTSKDRANDPALPPKAILRR